MTSSTPSSWYTNIARETQKYFFSFFSLSLSLSLSLCFSLCLSIFLFLSSFLLSVFLSTHVRGYFFYIFVSATSFVQVTNVIYCASSSPVHLQQPSHHAFNYFSTRHEYRPKRRQSLYNIYISVLINLQNRHNLSPRQDNGTLVVMLLNITG